MIRIHTVIPIATTTADSFYIPVPCRGNVKAFKVVHDQETDLDEVWTLYRGSTAVSVCTPAADATAEGTVISGVMDTTNGELIFDPDSSTVANKVFKIGTLNTVDAGGNLGVYIEFDDSAAVTQDPALA